MTVLLIATAVMTIDLGILWLATPALAEDLKPSNSEVLWVNDSYGLAIASTLVIMGNIGDRLGHRRVLIGGAVVFCAASVLAALAGSATMLIGARVTLGVAGAALIPATLALIRKMHPDPGTRQRAVAAWVTALSVGIAIGPVIGGIVVSHSSWRICFLIGVPLILPLLVSAPVVLPRALPTTRNRLDGWSVPLFAATTVPFFFAVKSLGEHGPVSVWTLVPLVGSMLAGWMFTRRQRRLAHPLLDLGLLRAAELRFAVVLLLVGLAALNGVEYLVPQMLQLVHELPPVQAGLLMIAPALGFALGSQLTPRLVQRREALPVLAIGAGVATIGLIVLTVPVTTQSSAALIGAVTVVMSGLAPIAVLGTSMAVSAAGPERAGQAAAIGQTAYELGLAAGIAIIGTAATGLYSARVSQASPSGDPETVALLRKSFTAIAGDNGSHDSLYSLARDALTDGFRLASMLSAIACAAIVVGCALTARRRARSDREGAQS